MSAPLALIAVVALPAFAEEWGHRGSLGLLAGAGYENRIALSQGRSDTGHRLIPEIGGTLALPRNWSAKVSVRLSLFGPVGVAVLAGMRSYFGERLKTFVDLDLAVHLTPIVTVGPHFAFGVQYELWSVVGVFATGGVQFGLSPAGIRLSFEVSTGLQFRTYIFE